MSKPKQYACLRWSLWGVSLVAATTSSWAIYSAHTNGIFLPQFATSVTFVAVSLICVLLMGCVAALVNSVVILTAFGVLMGIVFIMSLVTIVGAIIFLLLTSKIVFYPFAPAIALTVCFYFLTMIPLALKDVIRRMDIRDGGEYDPEYDRPSSPPIVLS